MDSYIKSGGTWLHTAYMYTKVNGEWIMIFDAQKSNDAIAPGLSITAPTSTSSASPTYYSTGATYRVYGTVTDSESGVYCVYVNSNPATLDGTSWYYDITLTANTTTTVSVYAVDNAGNETAVYTRYVYYDTVNPTLNVTAPTGTSSSSPTYVQSDSATSYTVTGTVSDTAGIKSVTVNGTAATISGTSWSCKLSSLATNTTHTIKVVATDNSGRTTTVNRYLRVEAYYQQAARVAGTTVQTSLANTLTNSTVCTAIAGNSTAYGIMKSKYSSTMTSYIDSNWNVGLNLLNYRCKLKCYLYHSGNVCSDITGGFTYYYGASNTGSYINLSPSSGAEHSFARTTNVVNLSDYTKLSTVISYVSGNVKCGLVSTSGGTWNETYVVGSGEVKTAQTKTLTISGQTGYRYQCNSWGSGQVTNVYVAP